MLIRKGRETGRWRGGEEALGEGRILSHSRGANSASFEAEGMVRGGVTWMGMGGDENGDGMERKEKETRLRQDPIKKSNTERSVKMELSNANYGRGKARKVTQRSRFLPRRTLQTRDRWMTRMVGKLTALHS